MIHFEIKQKRHPRRCLFCFNGGHSIHVIYSSHYGQSTLTVPPWFGNEGKKKS